MVLCHFFNFRAQDCIKKKSSSFPSFEENFEELDFNFRSQWKIIFIRLKVAKNQGRHNLDYDWHKEQLTGVTMTWSISYSGGGFSNRIVIESALLASYFLFMVSLVTWWLRQSKRISLNAWYSLEIMFETLSLFHFFATGMYQNSDPNFKTGSF